MGLAGERIRSPIASGLFYPDNHRDIMNAFKIFGLERRRGSLPAAEPVRYLPPKNAVELTGKDQSYTDTLAVVVPHAAWNLSGEQAAQGFNSCNDRKSISRVVLLGTIHDPLRAGLFLSDSDSFDTPLGKVPVDNEANEDLASCSTVFEINDIPHLREFSIEVILPFVKYCFPKASIVPILMGFCSPHIVKGLASALNLVFGGERGKTLFIISTCLSKNMKKEQASFQAELFTKLLLEGNGEAIGNGFLDGSISGCSAPLAAAFLESGLSENKKNRVLSSGIKNVPAETGYVCYGSLVLE